jgi:hypothetical protein
MQQHWSQSRRNFWSLDVQSPVPASHNLLESNETIIKFLSKLLEAVQLVKLAWRHNHQHQQSLRLCTLTANLAQ